MSEPISRLITCWRSLKWRLARCWPGAQVGEKENEMSAAPPMLEGHCLQGRLSSSDAMQTQVKFCQLLHRLHADGLFIAKDNQPQLHEDLVLSFEDRQADRSTWRTSETTTKGHGRLETRIVTTTADLASWSSRSVGRHRAGVPCGATH